jgi:TonB family protein
MTDALKQWEGQIVEGIFPLRQFLGASDHSAVFLTEYREGHPQKAAIKLFPADPVTADSQLSSWEFAGALSHPNLLRLFGSGRSRIDGNDLLYLVMEYAEEDLSQILPQRALTAEEARDMLGPVLDALEFLHGKGLVHGDLKPSNILATGDRLKLSSDRISEVRESSSIKWQPSAYDAPEVTTGMLTPAADVWSLGTALVEVLTQRLPEWQPGSHLEPVVPASLPAPFLEIARQCLRLAPEQRMSIAEIGARLNSRAATAAASVSGSVSDASPSVGLLPAAGQVPSVSSRPMASLGVPPRGAARIQNNPHRPPPYRDSRSRSRFLVPLAVGALFFAGILTVPRLLTHRPEAPSRPTATSEKLPGRPAAQKPAESVAASKQRPSSKAAPASNPTAKSISPALPQLDQRSAGDSLKTTSERESRSHAASPVNPVARGSASAKGDVLDQVLPDVSQKARASIHGKVRVSVKVHVDPSGGVSAAEFDAPGPSRFFADLALEAARKWAFTPPEVNGRSLASEWLLRFEFTQKDTRVRPTQLAP